VEQEKVFPQKKVFSSYLFVGNIGRTPHTEMVFRRCNNKDKSMEKQREKSDLKCRHNLA
jgi:hypothetical protein